jgi:hypothetical protein
MYKTPTYDQSLRLANHCFLPPAELGPRLTCADGSFCQALEFALSKSGRLVL